MDDKVGCFNTGLYDKTWQPILFYCIKNPLEGFQEWKFMAFHNSYTIKYTDIANTVVSALRRASYFDDPSALIYDMSCPTNEQLIAIRKLNTLTSNIV